MKIPTAAKPPKEFSETPSRKKNSAADKNTIEL